VNEDYIHTTFIYIYIYSTYTLTYFHSIGLMWHCPLFIGFCFFLIKTDIRDDGSRMGVG
jgi:hypothetical protein